ncbi:hypothetical protein G647_00255 [Cladophialophora carrionii CBS 160.54]|uniref:F-box domain-containing protein n=1 Tax=Cladophialophora carrionii CBS 160.54 TaxID=1279043 RepID=V9DMB9_9EURO|nr:uncharacterized protein G647_00255 [Cladophialophora carrionii CBS 160.54]ETI27806.1 hypothetical protein G647_00255 [Cladophialophora carrionii CBS 160.54]
MLPDLPVEVIEQIVGYLPSASAIVNLARTERNLHSIVSADGYHVFRSFVQNAFPTIKTPPLWRDAARILTSRSRAWDRRAFIARECYPPPDNIDYPQYALGSHKIGYHPAIDSYETWEGHSWSNRKEVLAWGAAGRLRTRTIKDGVTTWSSYSIPDDHRQDLDILDVRILRPHQVNSSDGETIVFRRANHEVVKVQTSEPDVFTQQSSYVTPPGDHTCMDISQSADPILAACGDHSIRLYPVRSQQKLVRPSDSVKLEDRYKIQQRMRCIKFLSGTTVAIANQFLQGRDRAPIHIYDISQTGLSSTPLTESMSYSETSNPYMSRHSANVIVPLDDIGISGSSPGTLFLSGWTDGIARLHDTRIAQKSVVEYVDAVDSGQILSLLTVGHEHFLAGSSENGCLRTFDLRMPGAKAYSYLNARQTQPTRSPKKTEPQRGINIFLTPTVNFGERLWEPLPRNPRKRSQGYRGSVYSLSSPSPSSPTVYAGIENHVLQLDFVSTDDIRSHKTDIDLNSHDAKGRDSEQPILNLSCYERPREGKESTDPVLLRKQLDLSWALKYGNIDSEGGSREEGWDERLRLNTSVKDRGHRESGWRTHRRQPT